MALNRYIHTLFHKLGSFDALFDLLLVGDVRLARERFVQTRPEVGVPSRVFAT